MATVADWVDSLIVTDVSVSVHARLLSTFRPTKSAKEILKHAETERP